MNRLHTWMWKWHIIGGLITLPVVLILSITGAIYLFKDTYEQPQLNELKKVVETGPHLSFQEQWNRVIRDWEKKPMAMVVPVTETETVEFTSGRFSGKSSIYIHPFTGAITGHLQVNQTDMYTIRKLHGELLLGVWGTKVVECVASWMVVLLITGMLIFWPKKGNWSMSFRIRTKGSRRLFFRDVHRVTAFWCSGLLLLILAGGLPWTDGFGTGYKWIQKQTNTGYPKAWRSAFHTSEKKGKPLPLDHMVGVAQKLKLEGTVTIGLPTSENGVYSISNSTHQLSKLVMRHYDQYTGALLYAGGWEHIGVLMKARLWVMAFHQGQFGPWNWWLVLLTALALLVLSIAAILSYWIRKPKHGWGIPQPPHGFKPGKLMIGLVIVLGVLLPGFGLSVIGIYLGERWLKRRQTG